MRFSAQCWMKSSVVRETSARSELRSSMKVLISRETVKLSDVLLVLRLPACVRQTRGVLLNPACSPLAPARRPRNPEAFPHPEVLLPHGRSFRNAHLLRDNCPYQPPRPSPAK